MIKRHYAMPKSDADLRIKYPNMTDDDLKAFKVRKGRLFKGSIAVCCVYGFIALVLLLVAMFTERGREVLAGDLMTFVVTLVAGMIFIILILVIMIATFKPVHMTKDIYDPDLCPDYWKVQATPSSEFPPNIDDTDKYLMKYRCVPDKSVVDLGARWNDDQIAFDLRPDAPTLNAYDQHAFQDGASGATTYAEIMGDDSIAKKMKEVSATMYKSDIKYGDTPIDVKKYTICSKVYPELMAKEDLAGFPNNPNALRCKWAKTCNVPWSSACPNI